MHKCSTSDSDIFSTVQKFDRHLLKHLQASPTCCRALLVPQWNCQRQPAILILVKKRRKLASSLLIQKCSCFISSASVGRSQRNGTRLHYEQALRLRALCPHCFSGRCSCTLPPSLHFSQTRNFSQLRVCIPRRLKTSHCYGSAFLADSDFLPATGLHFEQAPCTQGMCAHVRALRIS